MLNTHGSEQLQRKSKAELALIDPVDANLDVDDRPLRLQAPGEVLVGDVFLLPKVFDQGFGTSLVKLARSWLGVHGFPFRRTVRDAI